jgi:cell division protein FtsW
MFMRSRPSACSTTITLVASALLALGVVMVFSASASLTSPPITENILKNSSFRQAAFTFAALLTLLFFGLCPYDTWRLRERSWWQPTLFLYLATLALVAVVLVPGIGEERNGARRWLSLGPSAMGLGFQPSELAKLSLVLFMAAYCAAIGERIRKFWTGLLPALLLVAIPAGLVGKEDFGTAVLLVAVGGAILIGAGARWWHLMLMAVPVLAGIGYLVTAESYRIQRLLTFRDPFADAQGAGYHQVQSLITIASGGWWGLGLGAGVQKYGYLPEGRSDFIFSVICEELGVVGGIAVIALFGVFLWQGARAVSAGRCPFGKLLALGATLMVGLQATMNIAVVTVSVPTKGIGLPFVSAGGSGVLFLSILVGMLVNIARHRPAPAVNAVELPAPAPQQVGPPPAKTHEWPHASAQLA